MNKPFPLKNKKLILAVLGILIIGAAATLVFKMYLGTKAEPPKPVPASVQPGAVTPPSKVPVPVKEGQAAVTTTSKKPEITPAATTQGTAPTPAPPAVYEYNSRGRRDPFASLLVEAEPEKKKGGPPIESYDVSDFKLTAILWNKSGFYVLVSSPDGKNFTLRQGTTIGLHNGKVYKITKDSVIIRQFLKDYRGTVRPHDFVLKLHRGEEE